MKTILFIIFLFFTVVSCETESGASECIINNTGFIKIINNDSIVHTIYIFDNNLIPLDTISADTNDTYSYDIKIGDYLLGGTYPYDSILNVRICDGYIYKFPPK